MGLDELIDDEGTAKNLAQFRRYGSHEEDDRIWGIIEEMQERFPVEIECDMVEVATDDVNYDAKAYYRVKGGTHYQYLRVKESCLHGDPVYVRHIILHEMVHLYCYQMGHSEISDGSPMFKWLCGRVGCTLSQIEWNGMDWKDLADPMLESDMVSTRF